jgi:hypothetical protein
MTGPNGHRPTSVRVLPERWASRVSSFIRSAGTAEEAAAEDRPEMVFSRVYLPTQMNFYSDFNIRSRHFRCLETFFVEADDADEIRAVVSLEGLRTARRVSNVNLIVARVPADDGGAHLAELLGAVLREAGKYSATSKLRFTYIFDTSFEAPLGVRVSKFLTEPPADVPFVEEARIANETGKNREAVLLSFTDVQNGHARSVVEDPEAVSGS